MVLYKNNVFPFSLATRFNFNFKENIKEMYENYHKLGGNGMVTKIVNKLYELPNVKEEDKI